MYKDSLGLHTGRSCKTHPTRFKEWLLSTFPEMTAVSHGRTFSQVLLSFQGSLGEALHKAKHSSDTEAIDMMHTAKLIRNKLFKSKYCFNGSISSDCMQENIPPILISLIGMIWSGPSQCHTIDNTAALSIAQLIVFNSVRNCRKNAKMVDNACATYVVRHSKDKETSLPIYIGVMLHSATRKKKFVDRFFYLGLSVSYERVMQLSNSMANSICKEYEGEQLVCPRNMQHNTFTVSAVDNIDHKPSSKTARSSFHGTAISLFQFPNRDSCISDKIPSFSIDDSDITSKLLTLPSVYTEVTPCILPTTTHQYHLFTHCQQLRIWLNWWLSKKEYLWLDKKKHCIDNDSKPENVSWAA